MVDAFASFCSIPSAPKKPKNSQQARSVSTTSRALKVLASKPENAGYDLVLKDYAPPAASARRFLAALRRNRRAIPVVVISSASTAPAATATGAADADADAAIQDEDDSAAKCLQAGAADFIVGPLGIDECSNLYARVFWWRRVSSNRICRRKQGWQFEGEGDERRMLASSRAAFFFHQQRRIFSTSTLT